MKVHIGPYPSVKSTKNRKISVRIDKYDIWGMDNTLSHIILPMLKMLRKVKHGAPNTDDEDVPKKLRSTSAPKKKNEYDIDKNHFKRWDYILDEMIWAFSQYNTNWERKFHSGKSDILWQSLDKDRKPVGKPRKIGAEKTEEEKNAPFSQMVKGPKDTRKFDAKGYKKHEDRMRNGFKLFGKYYMNLWD